MARAREIFASPPEPPPSLHEADDDRVVATVDGGGKLIRTDITYRAMRDFGAAELSTACTQALKAARTLLATAMREAFESIPRFNLPEDARPFSVDDIIRQAKEISGWRG